MAAQDKKTSRKSIKAKMHKDATQMRWASFDDFWATNIKNGSDTTKAACIAHIKALGKWKDQSEWVNAIIHFGIPVEK
jgi:hypothetical protein